MPSVQGRRMVFSQHTPSPENVWRTPGGGASVPNREPERLITSSGWDHHPAYSQDGEKIAFQSSRSGIDNIWVCASDAVWYMALARLTKL